jgi:hypothetical protein
MMHKAEHALGYAEGDEGCKKGEGGCDMKGLGIGLKHMKPLVSHLRYLLHGAIPPFQIRNPIVLLGFVSILIADTPWGSTTDKIPEFKGKFFYGKGDVEYLQLLDIARRMFSPDPEFQNVPMLYTPSWNGLYEGPTWQAWWVQNSYGTTYCALPFLEEPLLTFLQNSQDLWFDQMGDGKTPRPFRHFNWIPPDGCLCDCAAPGWFVAKQGDGRVEIHDWGMEFTAAGLLMQAELLLTTRDMKAIARYLPKLERCASFIESRRDPKTNLFLAGPAANLLAPSYAGWKRPDGSYGHAYLAGLSITYIAALERLIALEELAGREEMARIYRERKESARKGLPLLMTDEGYFVKSLDPDGTRHGVYGAEKHGYFEAVVNHDAIALRIVDDVNAEKIYAKIASIPGLRPYNLIITNYPSLDDMYEEPRGLWEFGTWVNGGHWSTCEARMILGYFRLGKYEDARRSMLRILDFARRFRMDNPLTKFGSDVYQPHEPINITYDAFGPPAALIRGLFEYIYDAKGLTLIPHIPPSIVEMEQRFPIRFGSKRLFLATFGRGKITGVWVNGRRWRNFDARSIYLPYDSLPQVSYICIGLGGSKPSRFRWQPYSPNLDPSYEEKENAERYAEQHGLRKDMEELARKAERIRSIYNRLIKEGLGERYPAMHARLALEAICAVYQRFSALAEGRIRPLPEPSQNAADRLYLDTAQRLCAGLEKTEAIDDDGR